MSKPSFSIVAITLVVLAALGFVIQAFKRMLPPVQPNSMEAEVGTFMRQASQEAIHWRPLSQTALDAAKNDDKSLNKYAEAIASIEQGNFEPQPDARVCPNCPCYFMCRA